MTTKKAVPEPQKTSSRWGPDRRLEFIDFRLRWDGRLNRADLVAFFGISVPQASLDIAKYLELAPDNLVYDRSSRVYVATKEFKPVYDTSSPSRLLNELLAHAVGVIGDESSFIGWRAPVGYVPTPGRTLSADTLAVLLRAVREGRVVQLVYQSMSAEKPEPRLISPHAFAHDGFRWHVRAYCHKHQAFRDFVIARMADVKLGDLAVVLGAENDVEWHTEVTLELEPHPGLSSAQKRAVELDYGMTNGVVSFKCRQALLFYVLRHLHLDRAESGTPEQQQVVLKSTL
ncbi:MAG: WYL domain-containing protein [Rhodoferax sp.]|uniref:helix-turn-helix transcriptional regulator n=1 Tax=Rhodoferax sp. TaxID=50421 RepID=UPI00182C471A|nr:WYL domain-containing protein [Rhodoferax sp.]NMM12407.1 WYL domain-containing protein [Rhodoferax sp.]NMM18726.1 WYL domain-containing protein [Rhodoferax sp.]